MEYVEGHLEVWTSAGRELLSMPAPRSTIGSSETADLVVSDGSVSRVHALLEWLGGSWFVQDLGSRNGTFVNGERVQVMRSGWGERGSCCAASSVSRARRRW